MSNLGLLQLYCLGNFASELNTKQAVFQRPANRLYMIGKLETLLEITGSDITVEKSALCLFLKLAAGHFQSVGPGHGTV